MQRFGASNALPAKRSLARRTASRIKWAFLKAWNRRRSALAARRQYQLDWRAYERLPGAEPLRRADAYPCLDDRTATTPIDAHYFYQAVWAAKAIHDSGAQKHVDVGSDHKYVGMLTAFTTVVFIDLRPLPVTVDGLECREGSILALPFEDKSVASLSCLHVAEHIGLGRYGDPLDVRGTQKACAELARVLAPGGNLYFSVPVGMSRVQFNAHRIHTPAQILGYFADLQLEAFGAVTDKETFVPKANPNQFAQARYACGLFHFTRK